MNTNTTIKKYQDELISVINRAGTELSPTIVKLILQNLLYQVDVQVQIALNREAQTSQIQTQQDE